MQLRFHHTRLSAIGISLPDAFVGSSTLEDWLQPTYSRLGLVPGRLEAMTGIRRRGFFPEGTRPSAISRLAAEDCLRRSSFPREKIDVLVHASVCRDQLEPATALRVHRDLGLSSRCLPFDLSNACLGGLNAWIAGAGLIESGQANAVLVVCGEDARPVVECTVDRLNSDGTLTRRSLKPSLATLTLGSAGTAALLTRDRGARLLGGAFECDSSAADLCLGDPDEMRTDSERMLELGVALAARTWDITRETLGWARADRYFMHQVGSAHRNALIEALSLDPDCDWNTFSEFGNTGSSAIGLALAQGARAGIVKEGSSVALLGIGSGLVCGMLGLEWSEETSA